MYLRSLEQNNTRNYLDIDIDQFDQRLSSFDWYFAFSDDARVYMAGEAEWKRLVAMQKDRPDFEKLFVAYRDYYCSGPAWNTPQFTKRQLNDVRQSLGVTINTTITGDKHEL